MYISTNLIFIVLPVICIILVPLGGIPYLCGRLSFHMGLVVCMVYPAIGVFIIYCFIASILRLLRDLEKHNVKKKLIIVTEIIIPLFFIALIIVTFYAIAFTPIKLNLCVPPGKAFTYGFRDRIRSKADIPAIRDWLRTINKEDYIEHSISLHRDKWPKSLGELKPGSVTLGTDKNGNYMAVLNYGAAFEHWGVYIGMRDMRISPSDFSEWKEYGLIVEPGVYVWCEL